MSATSRLGPSTRSPAIDTEPSVAGTSPAAMRSSVDFPQPERPTTVTSSPSATWTSTSPIASTTPERVSKRFETRSMSMRASAIAMPYGR